MPALRAGRGNRKDDAPSADADADAAKRREDVMPAAATCGGAARRTTTDDDRMPLAYRAMTQGTKDTWRFIVASRLAYLHKKTGLRNRGLPTVRFWY